MALFTANTAIVLSAPAVKAQSSDLKQSPRFDTPLSSLQASDLFPLETGSYIDYDAYKTDTSGVPNVTTCTHAASNVVTDGLSFGGLNGVAMVCDTSVGSGTSSNSVSNVRYISNASGDVLAYADQSFLGLFAPPAVAASLTPPDSFVNYLALSFGIDNSYPVLSLSQDVKYQGLPLTIEVVMTGAFRGVEHLSVPAGDFDSAYHFTFKANIKALSHGTPLTEITNAEEVWLVRGIGIVKTNTPTVKNPFITVQGVQRVMVGYNKQQIISDGVSTSSSTSSAANFFPNPANSETRLQLPANAGSAQHLELNLYSVSGALVRSLPSSNSNATVVLDTQSLPSGDYFLSLQASGARPQIFRLSIAH